MSAILDYAERAESNGSQPVPEAERKLTVEELRDMIGPRATRGDHLTRAEREVYARQLVELVYPDKPGAHRSMIMLLVPTVAERREWAEESARGRKPPRQPPPGKTWHDMVIGQWPGDETDEEINAWLEEIS